MATFGTSTHDVDVESLRFNIKKFRDFVALDINYVTNSGEDVEHTLYFKDRNTVVFDKPEVLEGIIHACQKALKKNVKVDDFTAKANDFTK